MLRFMLAQSSHDGDVRSKCVLKAPGSRACTTAHLTLSARGCADAWSWSSTMRSQAASLSNRPASSPKLYCRMPVSLFSERPRVRGA
eukprot:1051157-Amphidinium_carterae.1